MEKFELPFRPGETSAGQERREIAKSIREVIEKSAHVFLKNEQKTIAVLESVLEQYGAGEVLQELSEWHQESFEHSVRMAALSADIAIERRENNLDGIALGALLHDIGKLSVSQETLSKEENFTAEDRAAVETHALKGLELLSKDGRFAEMFRVPLVKEIVGCHHFLKTEKPYPSAEELAKYQVHPEACDEETKRAVEMTTVADVYDALAGGRKFNKRDIAPKVQPEAVFKVIERTERVPDDLIASALERYMPRPAAA